MKYIYNQKIGHYIQVINEADDVTVDNTTNQTSNTNTTNNNTSNNTSNSSVSTSFKDPYQDDTIANLKEKIAKQEETYNKNKITTENTLATAEKQVKDNINNNKYATYKYDPLECDSTILNIKLKQLNDEKNWFIQKNQMQQQILTQLKKLSSETKDQSETFKEKYSKYLSLNESEIQNAKIYLGNLIKNDENHILKSLSDLKKAVKNNRLLCGKDKDGYFVVCLDKSDFDSLTNTLIELGYIQEEIVDTIIPQLFNRKNLVF